MAESSHEYGRRQVQVTSVEWLLPLLGLGYLSGSWLGA
ncbi:hypothetical protein Q427_13025 [Halomonas sp. BC04]|nr:hypothetical protein Q427_13025 [Halomonas sp. BC04]